MRKIIWGLIFTLTTTALAQQTQVIAHRGFWDATGSAQNSIAALVKADSIGCYGAEFDVWLTDDGELMINHDSSFGGHSMEKSPAALLRTLRLKNGETMPTLRQYLEKGSALKTKLILELKAHSAPEKETQAVEKIIALVKELGMEQRMEYISFSLHAVKAFIRASSAPVFYLSGDLSPVELQQTGAAGADYNTAIFLNKPEWIAQIQQLGMKVNSWTVNSPEQMKQFISQKVDFITTDAPLTLQTILNNQ
jgi:glycerophosphoryl diester phosphodiesterase